MFLVCEKRSFFPPLSFCVDVKKGVVAATLLAPEGWGGGVPLYPLYPVGTGGT